MPYSAALALCTLFCVAVPAHVRSASFDASFYRLTTQWQGDGKSLDVVNDGVNNQLQLAPTGNYPGQYWKITATGTGYYRLTTLWQGDGKSLDVVNDGVNNKLQLAPTGDYSGQYWKITATGTGYYRLTTLWQGDGKSLDVVNDGVNNKLQLAPTGNYSGQYWKIVALNQPLITLNDLSASLSSSSQGVDLALASSSLMLNGAHSRPLSRLVEAGKKTGWMLGDWGRDDHGSRDGSTGLAELGGGYNFGPAQVNVSAGQTWSNQNLPNNGDVDYTGHYLMIEGIVPVSPARGLFATIGAYGHWGEADIRRGYLVASAQNYSSASPDTKTLGLRARLDWQNAFAWSGAQFSPYTDLSYAETRMDGYTETGGAFPATFNERTDHATDLRVGLNTSKPIPSTTFNFVSNLEVAHRFEDRGAATSGNITGLFAFDLAGEKYKRTWMKAGVGVEGQLGAGKASLMLNATSKGEMPNVWLAASYQLTF